MTIRCSVKNSWIRVLKRKNRHGSHVDDGHNDGESFTQKCKGSNATSKESQVLVIW